MIICTLCLNEWILKFIVYNFCFRGAFRFLSMSMPIPTMIIPILMVAMLMIMDTNEKMQWLW